MGQLACFTLVISALAVALCTFAFEDEQQYVVPPVPDPVETEPAGQQGDKGESDEVSSGNDDSTEQHEGGGTIPGQQNELVLQVQTVFGWHLFFLVLVLLGTLLLWIFVRFLRPQPWFRDFQKKWQDDSSGFFSADASVIAHLDENDLTGSLTLVPGEAVFFNEEAALSFGGVFGCCSKLSVTNLRVIAQKTDTIFCGTCSVAPANNLKVLDPIPYP